MIFIKRRKDRFFIQYNDLQYLMNIFFIFNKKMQEINLSKKEIQSRLNNLRIQPQNLEARNYGVSIKYFETKNDKWNKRIDYSVRVELNIDKNNGVVSFEKKHVMINQHVPDLINEIFANKIPESLYPIEANMNEKGLGGSYIENYEDVLLRWKNKKEEILKKYQSEAVTDFLAKTSKIFYNINLLKQRLHNDWFWNLFFHPKLLHYGDNRTIEKTLYLSIVPYQYPFRFTGTQYIEKIPTNYHSFLVTYKSDEVEAPSYFRPKNITDNQKVYMCLDVFFDLDLYHHFPIHTRAYLTIYSKDLNKKKIQIRRIEFTMYQQNTSIYENKNLSNKSAFITGGIVRLPPNEWGFDNFERVANDW